MSDLESSPGLSGDETAQVADPLAIIVEIESALEFTMRGTGPTTSYVAHDRRTGRYFRFGTHEYHVVTLLDGTRSLQTVHDQLADDGVLWTPADVVAFAKELTQHHLARVVSLPNELGPESNQSASGAPGSSSPLPVQRWMSRALQIAGAMLSQRIPLANGDAVATRLLPLMGPLFSVPAMVGWCILVGSGVAISIQNAADFSLELRRIFDGQLWILIAVLWCGLKVIHECGHAVCAKRHGVHVGPMGIMFFLLAPLAYVDVTDAWKLIRRRDRLQIAMAGVYLELAIGAIAAWVWWAAPVGFSKHLAAQVFFVAGPATLLVNANPLLRLDGYYALSDALEIPNLRAQGRRQLVGYIEYLLLRLPPPQKQLVGWRNEFAVFHAICSVVFQIVWMTGLVFAVSQWAKGLGMVLACVATAVWAVVPLMRWLHKIWVIQPRDGWKLNEYQRRLVAVVGFAALGIQYAAMETSPFQRRVPIVVQYQDEQISRAASDAFVTSVYVQCGDRVQQGDLLIVLEQPELRLQRDQWNDQREVELAKAIQYQRRGEIASAVTAREQAESLQHQISEVDQQLEQMRVYANREGRVTSPLTDNLLGCYVKEGDELIRVADPQEKELLAVVAEDDLESYASAVDEESVGKVRLRGGVSINAKLAPLQPSASRALPHPALSATAGGPLAVQSADEDIEPEAMQGQRLVKPQLKAVLQLDAYSSLAVKAGQVGRLTIPDDRTLIARLWEHFSSTN